MKQIFAFGLLFCLVFLNVPRSIVHDCEHEHSVEHHEPSEHHSHDHDSNHSEEHHLASFETENESCFICEFDLDVFEIPTVKFESVAKFRNSNVLDPQFDCLGQTDFSAFSHRGPPTA